MKTIFLTNMISTLNSKYKHLNWYIALNHKKNLDFFSIFLGVAVFDLHAAMSKRYQIKNMSKIQGYLGIFLCEM